MDDELIDILDDARMSYDNLKEVWDKAQYWVLFEVDDA
jgi:hypothetical protein